MRKLLLATVATLGATFGLAGGAKAQPLKPVAAGTLVVHLNGYLQFSFGAYGSTYNQVTVPAGATAGTYKLNPISTIGDVRLYPGFDAMTRNGISYGAQLELRTGYSDASVGQNGKPVVTTSSGSSTLDSLYVKRAYGYVGTPATGYVRFGQTDSAFTLLQSGVVEAFGDGGQWTLEGGVRDMLPSAASPASQFIYADQAAVYSTDKFVYISPAFMGFSVAAGYEPNSDGIKEGYDSCTIAGSTCAAESASPISGDIGKRRKNTVDAQVQYALKANGWVVKASAGILHGAPISYDGAPTGFGTPLHLGYDDLQVYQAGAQATFAGLTVGANLKTGQVEDGYTFKPKGARDGLAYIIGASYVIGPYVVGASYFNSQTSGAYVPGVAAQFTGGPKIGRTLSEYGFAAGANYVIGPNLSLFTQYMYGHRHQPGVAFGGTTSVTTGTGAGAVTTKYANGSVGDAQVQLIAVGATLKW